MRRRICFCFTEAEGEVTLTSYDIPAGQDKNTFFLCYDAAGRICRFESLDQVYPCGLSLQGWRMGRRQREYVYPGFEIYAV